MNITNYITESKPYYVTLFCGLRNLHYLRERRKNSAENFVHGAKKAVKILDMLAGVKEQFSKAKAAGIALGLTTLLTFLPGAFNKAGAEDLPKEGTQIAMNTQPEGSGTKVDPASLHTPAPKELTPIEKFCGADKICTTREAWEASARQIVLHHGPGVEREVESELRALRSLGYPAIALPGGPDRLVRMLVAKLSPKKLYTGSNLDRGEFGATAIRIYDAKIKPLVEQTAAASQFTNE